MSYTWGDLDHEVRSRFKLSTDLPAHVDLNQQLSRQEYEKRITFYQHAAEFLETLSIRSKNQDDNTNGL